MNPEVFIAPTDLRDYAKAQGWALLKEAAKDRLYVMTNERFAGRQLVFPMDTSAPDYAEAVSLAVDKLAALEQKTRLQLIQNLTEVSDDTVAFRVSSPVLQQPFIPLAFAGAMVSGAQQLLLASACAVLKPQAHHPRLSRSEAQQFLHTTRFRHTRPGSFVLNVSCPVQAMDVQPPLLPEEVDAPFVRRTTLALYRSLCNLVAAIEADTLPQLVQDTKASQTPLISSNLCEALTHFDDDSLRNSVDIEIAWASSIRRPPDLGASSTVRIQQDYFSRIEEVRRELRSGEEDMDDTFVGTVEQLEGEMGNDGHRRGEVILSLLLPEGEQVRARTNLTADQYATADEAHMNDGNYVKVAGRLRPGRQPRQLSDLRTFELIKR